MSRSFRPGERDTLRVDALRDRFGAGSGTLS
jgi:hypothetical protein